MTSYPAIASFFSRLFAGKQKEKRVLVLGLDAAGKTTLLYRLATGEVVTTIPTIGFNVETVNIRLSNGRSLAVTGWDVGGCDKIRPLWKHYFNGVSGVIFMVDSNDHDRLVEAIEELFLLRAEFDDPSYGGRIPPFLVFANKQDLASAKSAEEFQGRLLKRNPRLPAAIKVFPIAATGPKAEFRKCSDVAFTWFDERICESDGGQKTPVTNEAGQGEKSTSDSAFKNPRSAENLAKKLESWVQRSHQDSDPDDFLQQFREYNLPSWDHYTHIRLAYIILKKYGRQKGKNIIFDGIEAYIKNSSQTTGRTFHVTMTYFWIQMVHYGMMVMKSSTGEQTEVDGFSALLVFHPYLCDGLLWSDYYDKATIMTPMAQQGMVLPDKKPLPNVLPREMVPKKKITG